MLTTDQRIQMLIGSYAIQITAQQVELEQKNARIAELEAQLAEKAPEVPVQEGDDSSKRQFGRPVDNGGGTPV